MEKECFYDAVNGNDPNADDCNRLHPNGCEDCSYFLPVPPKPDGENEQDDPF